MVNNNISLIFQIDVVNNDNTADSIQSILAAFNDYAVVFKVGCVIGGQQHFFYHRNIWMESIIILRDTNHRVSLIILAYL